ncbi:9280_t:CDS:2, partial [Funneliformis caledonium]
MNNNISNIESSKNIIIQICLVTAWPITVSVCLITVTTHFQVRLATTVTHSQVSPITATHSQVCLTVLEHPTALQTTTIIHTTSTTTSVHL